MSIANYLSALVSQKNALAENLVSMGVSASTSEKLNTLVPKVLSIAGGGGPLTSLIDRTITEISESTVSSIGPYAFYGCSQLSRASFPSCRAIGSSAFYNCSNLSDIDFFYCQEIGPYAFTNCVSLSEITRSSFNYTDISQYAFYGCTGLEKADLNCGVSIYYSAFANCSNLSAVSLFNCRHIGSNVFSKCYQLVSLYLDNFCELMGNAFNSTPIGGYSGSAGRYGSIYVPASYYSQYLSASYWSDFSSRIVSY